MLQVKVIKSMAEVDRTAWDILVGDWFPVSLNGTGSRVWKKPDAQDPGQGGNPNTSRSMRENSLLLHVHCTSKATAWGSSSLITPGPTQRNGQGSSITQRCWLQRRSRRRLEYVF